MRPDCGFHMHWVNIAVASPGARGSSATGVYAPQNINIADETPNVSNNLFLDFDFILRSLSGNCLCQIYFTDNFIHPILSIINT